MKNQFKIMIVIALCVCFTSTVSFAGSYNRGRGGNGGNSHNNSRHHNKGHHCRHNKYATATAIGLGAAILGAAIFGQRNQNTQSSTVVYANSAPRCQPRFERVWVEPVYEYRRIPGHYNLGGYWIRPCKKAYLVKEGYWIERRVSRY